MERAVHSVQKWNCGKTDKRIEIVKEEIKMIKGDKFTTNQARIGLKALKTRMEESTEVFELIEQLQQKGTAQKTKKD